METVGVKIVVQGGEQATKQLSGFNQALSTLQKQSGQASKLKLGGGMENLSSVLGKLQSNLVNINPSIASATQNLTAFSGAGAAAIPVIGGLAAALAVGAAGWAAFFKLGARGAALQPTITAFGNLASQFGNSTDILNQFRADTKGTISDMELLRLATFSLSGASQELGTVLSKDLGKILNNTRKLAIALGRDPAEAQGRFIEAIKKNERELLDELGIIVGAEKAYQDYAKSIGTASTALTDQQKNTAFAIAAISQLESRVQSLGDQGSVIDNLRVPFVVFQNLLDKLSLSIQPAFAPVAQLLADISLGFQSVAELVFPIIDTLATLLGTLFTGAVGAAKLALDFFLPSFSSIGEIAPYIVAGVLIVRDAVNSLAGILSSVAGAFASALAPLKGIVQRAFGSAGGQMDVSINEFVGRASAGGGRIIGAFAAGMLNAGSAVASAAASIAQIVADFLEGFSPPKTGPLKDIDKGGANVARAWAEGFAGGMLQPIQAVISEVDTALGDIGKLSNEQVKARLGALDSALQPFQDRLDIIKGSFEQIAGFADPAIKTLEKQLAKAIKSQDVAQAQFLDKQVSALSTLKNQEQERIDNAELQLALAKAQQAQERALLAIQDKRTQAVKATTEAAGGGGAGASAKDALEAAAKAAGGGGAAQAPVSGATPAFTGGAAPDLLTPQSVQEAKDLISSSFQGGLAESGFNEALAGFGASTGELQTQLGRIKEANPAEAIANKFKQLPTEFTRIFTEAKTNALNALSTLPDEIGNKLTSIPALLQTSFAEPLNVLFASVFGEESPLKLGLAALFGEEGLFTTSFANLQTGMDNFATTLSLTVMSIGSSLQSLTTPFATAKTTIVGLVNDIKTAIQAFASDVGLSQLGATLTDQFVNVFISAANSVIGALEGAINNAIAPFTGIPGVGQALREIGLPVSINKIPTRAKGGLGVRGLNLVGEQGPELVNFGKPANIFPAPLTRSLMDTLAQPQGMAMSNGGGGATYNTTNNRTSNSTYNVNSPQQAVLLQRQQAVYEGF